MQKRTWHEVDWRKLSIILAIPVTLVAAFSAYVCLSPGSDVACVLNWNGKVIKAWGDDYKQPFVEGVVLHREP